MKIIIRLLLLLTPLSIWAQKPQFIIQSGLQTRVISSAISPDGRTALTVEENETLILWDVQSGKQLQSFKDIIFAEFSKKGRFLDVVTASYAFQTLDFNGKIIPQGPVLPIKNTGPDKNNRFSSARYYNDADLLLVAGRIYTKSRGQIGQIINTANFYSDKLKIIASAGNKDTINFLNPTTFKVEKTLLLTNFTWNNTYPRETRIQCIQISPDGNFLAAGHNEALEVKEIGTGKSIFTFNYFTPNNEKLIINKFGFSPDGKKLLIFCTDKITLIDLATKKEVWKIDIKTGDDQYSRGTICFSDNGKQVLIGKNQILNYYDVMTGTIVSKLMGIVPYIVDYQQVTGDNLVVEQNTKAVNWNLLTGELQKVTPANLPIEQYNSYHLAVNKKATKFYNYLSEIEGKTGSNKAFEKAAGVPRASILSLSADEKLLLHCVNESIFLNTNTKGIPQLIVSDVQTTKILWKKEGIDYAQFSRKGSFIAAASYMKSGEETNKILLLDGKTGNIAQTITLPQNFDKVRNFIFSENDTYLYVRNMSGIVLVELASGKMTNINIRIPNSKSALQHAVFTADEKSLIFTDFQYGNVYFYNIALQKIEPEKTIKAHPTEVTALSVTKNGRFLFTNAKENSVKLWDLETRTLVATLYSNSDNEGWAVVTPEGRFDGTEDMQEGMYFVKGIDRIPLASLFEKFYTPHLLSRLLAGEKFNPIDVKVEDLKAIPTVKIIVENKQRNLVVSDDIPSYNIDNEQVTLKVQADCPSDVVTEIQLFQNGKLVGSTRNLTVEDDNAKGEKSLLKTFNITLNNGENKFKALALNSQKTESTPDEIILNYKAPKPSNAQNTEGVTLHLVVIGINKYKNPKYNLNYATADATAFKEAIEKNGTAIFSKTNVVLIGDDKATKAGISAELEKVKMAAKASDVFIFYFAGHGVLNEKKEFFLVPHDVTQLYGADDALAQRGLSAKELQQFSRDIKAQKQLFILDACQSAGALETLAAARGAAEEKAIAQLARATGTHWLTASGSEQFASEFAQLGHGTFTYVLLEALAGKADSGRDKKITVKELDAYLQEVVPELTAKYKGTPQYPSSYGFGNDFPIGVVKQ